jgi:hypothetical protein
MIGRIGLYSGSILTESSSEFGFELYVGNTPEERFPLTIEGRRSEDKRGEEKTRRLDSYATEDKRELCSPS